MEDRSLHPISLVSRRTGLSPFLIRIWEQRYQAVEPSRTETKRRLYSEQNIERLCLLRDLTQAGHSIGQIARLGDGELRGLARRTPRDDAPQARASPAPADRMDAAFAALQAFDSSALAAVLQEAQLQSGAFAALLKFVAPLVQEIGERWRTGRLTAAQEHFASSTLRAWLGAQAAAFSLPASAPVLVAGTPSGQVHEMGILLAGAVASNLGWRVTQLGASLPAVEIASAARLTGARAIALSIVYPEDDPNLGAELVQLRELAPADAAILAGGRAAPAYLPALEKARYTHVASLEEFGRALDALRKRPPAGGA
jgi:DNA-binding transcriptional MerR regulator/methylmalonyl-CoA mutase cobalamin-binding subunit